MSIQHSLAAAALAAVLSGLILPALAQAPGSMNAMPDQGMGTSRMGQDMGRGMMSRSMMSRGMMSGNTMAGGCAGMMQSMGGGDGRPNSQWRSRPPNGRAVPD